MSEWYLFWEKFYNQVHLRLRLPTAEKHAALKYCLGGRAAEVVHFVPPTAADYDITIATLKNEFGSPFFYTSGIIHSLMRLKKATNPSEGATNVSQQKNIVLQLEKRGLAFGPGSRDNFWLLPILTAQHSDEIVSSWYTKILDRQTKNGVALPKLPYEEPFHAEDDAFNVRDFLYYVQNRYSSSATVKAIPAAKPTNPGSNPNGGKGKGKNKKGGKSVTFQAGQSPSTPSSSGVSTQSSPEGNQGKGKGKKGKGKGKPNAGNQATGSATGNVANPGKGPVTTATQPPPNPSTTPHAKRQNKKKKGQALVAQGEDDETGEDSSVVMVVQKKKSETEEKPIKFYDSGCLFCGTKGNHEPADCPRIWSMPYKEKFARVRRAKGPDGKGCCFTCFKRHNEDSPECVQAPCNVECGTGMKCGIRHHPAFHYKRAERPAD
jgi:hypothetical protein